MQAGSREQPVRQAGTMQAGSLVQPGMPGNCGSCASIQTWASAVDTHPLLRGHTVQLCCGVLPSQGAEAPLQSVKQSWGSKASGPMHFLAYWLQQQYI